MTNKDLDETYPFHTRRTTKKQKTPGRESQGK